MISGFYSLVSFCLVFRLSSAEFMVLRFGKSTGKQKSGKRAGFIDIFLVVISGFYSGLAGSAIFRNHDIVWMEIAMDEHGVLGEFVDAVVENLLGIFFEFVGAIDLGFEFVG